MLAETREIQIMLANLDHNVSLLILEAERKHLEDKKKIAELEELIKKLISEASK